MNLKTVLQCATLGLIIVLALILGVFIAKISWTLFLMGGGPAITGVVVAVVYLALVILIADNTWRLIQDLRAKEKVQ